MRRIAAGPSRSTELVIQIVGAVERSTSRIHEDLRAMASRGVVLIDAREQVVRLVDDQNRLSGNAADGVGDDEGRDAITPMRFGIFVVSLSDELNGEAKARAERFGEFGLAGPGGP